MKEHFTTSSSFHLDYLKDIHYHFDNSPRCTSTRTVTQIGLRTSSPARYSRINTGSNSRTQSTVATSSAEAELYAIGLGISDSLHIYQLLQELQTTSAAEDLRLREHRGSAQPRQLLQYITIFDNIQITYPHLHRQYISTQSQQQARPQ